MSQPRSETGEYLKKIVGRKTSADVWDRFYRLNRFTAALQLPRERDGYPVRKVVGQPRKS